LRLCSLVYTGFPKIWCWRNCRGRTANTFLHNPAVAFGCLASLKSVTLWLIPVNFGCWDLAESSVRRMPYHISRTALRRFRYGISADLTRQPTLGRRRNRKCRHARYRKTCHGAMRLHSQKSLQPLVLHLCLRIVSSRAVYHLM